MYNTGDGNCNDLTIQRNSIPSHTSANLHPVKYFHNVITCCVLLHHATKWPTCRWDNCKQSDDNGINLY